MTDKITDSLVAVEPRTRRSIQEWTPAMFRSARLQADNGHLSLAADFADALMGDDRVGAALSTRANGLVSLPITFEPARGMKRLVKALEAGEDWWAAYPATALSQLLRWGIILGIGLAQTVWTDRGSSINRIIPVLKVWNPRHLRRDIENNRWLLKTGINGERDVSDDLIGEGPLEGLA
jgi:hypothetical protein